MKSLDWRTLPLAGTQLIEASAGTGKTFTITLLHLRLVLEEGIPARQIVVTTFTEAAAAELRGRIRARLEQVERCLGDRTRPLPDELAHWLPALIERLGAKPLHTRVRLALLDVDLAPIATIHGLCRRILADFPFATGAAFSAGQMIDAGALVDECLLDYWRRSLLATAPDPWHAGPLLALGRGALAQLVHTLLPLAEDAIELPDSTPVRHWWDDFRRRDHSALHARIEDPSHFKNAEKNACRRTLRALLAATGDAALPAHLGDALHAALDPDKLANVSPKACTQPVGTWPEIAELAALRPHFAGLSSRLQHACALAATRFVRAELQHRLAIAGQSTFDRLIADVAERLGGPGGDALAEAVGLAWPVALIDEFQDTDDRQWAIFERIWQRRGGPLILIGDPKQSIYAFRGGDIHAYLRVRDALPVGNSHSIHRNFRSTPQLLDALNSLYALAGGLGFADSGIDYVPVEAGRTSDAGDADAALTLRLLPTAEKIDRDALALSACADDIAAALADSVHPVAPGDIAVLLDTNRRVQELRALLAERGVPVVGAGKSSVLHSPLADDLQLLLHALLHPADMAALRGALATRLFGIGAAELIRLASSPADWQGWLDRFEGYRQRWQRLGILAVIEALVHAEAPRLLAAGDGERVLTDLRHLGELLQQAAADCYGPEQLYAWFVAERSGHPGDSDAAREYQLRIESEAKRVRLMTLHASKGLEFEQVYLPMAWRRKNPAPGDPRQKLARYHDEQRRLRIDLGGPELAEHQQIARLEDLQERMRQLYVGLTRARQRCVVYAWDDLQPTALVGHPARGALDVLLAAAWAAPAIAGAGDDHPAALAAQVPGLVLTTGFAQRVDVESAAPASLERRARTPLPEPRPDWSLHSFSSLIRWYAPADREAPQGAEDERDEEPPELAHERAAEPAHPELMRLASIKGPRFGDAVHQLLEEGPGAAPYAAQAARIRAVLARHAVEVRGPVGVDPVPAIGTLLDRTLQAELAPGLRLAGLSTRHQKPEFEFAFALDDAAWHRAAPLLASHGYADWWPGAPADATLRGLMKGYIDLVYAWEGRFHVLDYKTNWLGERLSDYTGARLDEAMAAHRYGLQALIYTVALHRYLDQRLDDYDPDHHLGEACYVFVRALGLAPGAGVWRRRFPRSLIEGLDALLDARENPA
jgi:exodeoxyribonuclease V beta subunit